MAIPTSRTKETATVFIDTDKCNGCGQCVEVCKDFGLEIVDKKVVKTDKTGNLSKQNNLLNFARKSLVTSANTK